MKQWLSVLLCLSLMFGEAAASRVIIVVSSEDHGLPYVDCAANSHDGRSMMTAFMLKIMDKIGGPYDIVPLSALQTVDISSGTVAYNRGTGSAYTTAYNAAIFPFFVPSLQRLSNRGLMSPDSLASSLYSTSIPVLLFGTSFTLTTTCSLDVDMPSLSTPGKVISLYNNNSRTTRLWIGQDEPNAISSAVTPGGSRVIIGARRNSSWVHNINEGSYAVPLGHNCRDCDSLVWSAPGFNGAADSGYVFSALKNNRADGSKPIVYSLPFGANLSVDPIWVAILGALAHLDSLSSGAVFSSSKLPLKVAIQVRGGWRRAARHISGGISPNDSTILKASIDSLASLRVPFTVGVNTDSLASYPDDKNWWQRAAPYVHYAPEQWGGVTVQPGLVGNNASWQRPLDPFGATRTRAIYGDGTCSGADTSLWCMLRANFYKCDSAFGASRTDRVPMAAAFDWVPTSITGTSMLNADSLIAFMAGAGVRGVVTNSFTRLSDPYGNSNPKSLSISGSRHRVLYGRSTGEYLPNWATTGFCDSGSARWDGGRLTAIEGGRKSLRQHDVFMGALFTGRARRECAEAYAAGGFDSLLYNIDMDPRIYTIHVSDLGSGVFADADDWPSRPGWWQIKALVNGARIINQLAGRTIIEFVYPKDL